MLKKLDWDSNFFGLQIAEYKESIQSNRSNQDIPFDLIYVISNLDKRIKFEGFTKTFQENKLVYLKKNLIHQPIQTDKIRSFKDSNFDREELYGLAFESGKYSRFKRDNNFKEEQFKKLYKVWVDNSIDSNYATDVIIYVEENKIVGFVTFKISEDIGTIGLIAVLSNMQGKGVGKQLIKYVENRLIEKGIFKLSIPTQKDNIEACSFYEKLDYKIEDNIIIKHFWRNDSI